MKKIFLIFLVAFGGMFMLTSCNEKSNKLNNHEELFVSSFKYQLTNFKDPASVTVISIDSSACDGKVVKFTISAKNSYGASTTETYVLSTARFTINDRTCGEGYLVDYYTVMSEGDKLIPSKSYYKDFYSALTDGKDFNLYYNVGNINKVLNEYKKTNGWV